MDPIETLMDEHRMIERVLDAIEGYVAALGRGEAGREDLGRFVEVIRKFADAAHHGKEEDILFRTMAEHGMPVDGGPLAVMLEEHEIGRRHVANLARAAEGNGPFSAEETDAVRGAAEGYVALLRAHIMKEDQVLYPMSKQMLPGEAWTAIAARFDAFESEDPAERERLVALAGSLVETYAG